MIEPPVGNEEIKEKIRSFLEGVLTEEEEAGLQEWIKESETHKLFFLTEQHNLSASMVWSPDEKTREKWFNLRSRLEGTGYGQSGKIKTRFWISVAAILFLAGFITSALLILMKKEEPPEIQSVVLSVPFGAKSKFTLPDSSHVWINSGSQFSYPSVFARERRVKLTGEAYFEVRKDALPFIVETNYGTVEVTGTSFNVKAYNRDDAFATTLVNGSVSVRNPSGSVVLKPGQQSVVVDNQLKIKEVDTELFTSWKDGKLIFEREPFPELMKKLELWYNVKIDYSDPSLSKIWYTGTIEMETITEVMQMVSKAAHVTYSFDSKTRIIKIKSR